MKIKANLFPKSLLTYFLFTILSISSVQATIYVSGTLNGITTWGADTVKVTGNLMVDSLYVQPGTIIEFQGKFMLTVNDYLEVNGEIGDTVLFTINDTTGFLNPDISIGGWGGIYIPYEAEINLNFCKIEFVKNLDLYIGTSPYSGAVFGDFNKINILNCNINSNYGNGIAGDPGSRAFISKSIIANNKGDGIIFWNSSLIIENITIRNNLGSGLVTHETFLTLTNSIIEFNGYDGIATGVWRPYIAGNLIQFNKRVGISIWGPFTARAFKDNIIRFNNGAGLYFSQGGGAPIANNLIYNNLGYGIELSNCNPTIINNTIVNNSLEAVKVHSEVSLGEFYNCIIRNNNNNGEQILYFPQYNSLKVINCNIEGLIPNDLDSEYANNIDLGPQFVEEDSFNFHLSDYSPCINAGTSDTTGLFLPQVDLDGNPRVFDGRIDMGAYEYQHDNFHIIKQPVNQTVCEGITTTLETEAIGGVIGYQWQKNGVDIPLANQRVLTIDPVSINNDGYYHCLIIADDKTVSTDTARLIVDYNIEINWQTDSISLCPGMDTLLSISTTNPENSNFQWYKNNQMIAGAVSSELEIVSPEIAQHDIYYCLVSNNCKSIESQDIDLHIFNLPDLVLPEDTTISTNDTLRIDAGSGFQEYLWNTGYENQILTIYGNEPGVYSYSVKVTDENSCSATEGITVTVASLSSINESFLNSDFKIYPNPVYDIIYLKTLNSISEEITISIVDITGKILLQKKFDNLLNSLIYQINVSDLAKGVYYLQIGNKQMIKVEKIVMN